MPETLSLFLSSPTKERVKKLIYKLKGIKYFIIMMEIIQFSKDFFFFLIADDAPELACLLIKSPLRFFYDIIAFYFH